MVYGPRRHTYVFYEGIQGDDVMCFVCCISGAWASRAISVKVRRHIHVINRYYNYIFACSIFCVNICLSRCVCMCT